MINTILMALPMIFQLFGIIRVGIECVKLQKTGKTNDEKHLALVKYINEVLNPVALNITKEQVDALVKVVVKLLNFKK